MTLDNRLIHGLNRLIPDDEEITLSIHPDECTKTEAGEMIVRNRVLGKQASILMSQECIGDAFVLKLVDVSNQDKVNTEYMLMAFDGIEIPDNSYGLFDHCKATVIDLSMYTCSFRTCESMFEDCRKLKEVIWGEIDTSRCTNMSKMFKHCYSLEKLDLSILDTANVIDMHEMFKCCTALKKIDLSSFDTSEVTSMAEMFTSCFSLETLDLSNFTSKSLRSVGGMFALCEKLKNIDISNLLIKSRIYHKDMFRQCEALKNIKHHPADKIVENETYDGKYYYRTHVV